jgi:hypothetical protein
MLRKVHKKYLDLAVLIAQEPGLSPLYAALQPGEAWVLDAKCFPEGLPARWGAFFRRWSLAYEVARMPHPMGEGDSPGAHVFRIAAVQFPRPIRHSWCSADHSTSFLREDESVDIQSLLQSRRPASPTDAA